MTVWNEKPWSQAQREWVVLHAASLSRAELAAHVGCSVSLLSHRLHDMGLTWIRGPRRWSEGDDQKLRELAGTIPVSQLCKSLKRDRQCVVKRAVRLGVGLVCRRMEIEDEQLRKLVAEGLTNQEIAKRMNKGRSTIFKRLQNLGLKAKPGSRAPLTCHGGWFFTPGRPKPPRAEPAPRERVGLPRVERVFIRGLVAYCERCCAPVVDTPHGWAEHNARVHVAPIRRIA